MKTSRKQKKANKRMARLRKKNRKATNATQNGLDNHTNPTISYQQTGSGLERRRTDSISLITLATNSEELESSSVKPSITLSSLFDEFKGFIARQSKITKKSDSKSLELKSLDYKPFDFEALTKFKQNETTYHYNNQSSSSDRSMISR